MDKYKKRILDRLKMGPIGYPERR